MPEKDCFDCELFHDSICNIKDESLCFFKPIAIKDCERKEMTVDWFGEN